MELRHFIDMAPGEWAPQVEFNLYGTLNCTHATLPGMRNRQWGRIIVVSSDAGRAGREPRKMPGPPWPISPARKAVGSPGNYCR